MAIRGLTSDFSYANIGVKKYQTKPQESCKTEPYYPKEQSRKSLFQQLLSLWESFYGRVFHRSRNQLNHVYQEHQFGQNVSKPAISSEWTLFNVAQRTNYHIRITWLRIAGFLYSLWANKRLRWGLLLLLVVAPLSKNIYLLFPEAGFGEFFIKTSLISIPNFIENLSIGEEGGWYWQTLYWWFWSNGEIWAPLIAIYGIFLLFPINYYPSYFVGIPFGYFLSLLVHRMVASSNEEIHQGFGTGIIAAWIILGVVTFVLSDKFLFNQNHRKRAAEARIIGLINTPGLSWEEKEALLKKEAKDWMKHDNELFSRTG